MIALSLKIAPYSVQTTYAKIQQTKCINLKSLITLLIDFIHVIYTQKKTQILMKMFSLNINDSSTAAPVSCVQ